MKIRGTGQPHGRCIGTSRKSSGVGRKLSLPNLADIAASLQWELCFGRSVWRKRRTNPNSGIVPLGARRNSVPELAGQFPHSLGAVSVLENDG